MGTIFHSNLDRVGNTPFVKIDDDSKEINLFMKLEGENPTGSIKDRAALNIIKKQISLGNLTKEKTILDASSGSYACSLSYFGKILSYKVKVVSGSKLTDDKLNFIKYFGADLTLHGDFTIEGNHYCRQIADENPEQYCFLDQLHNWDNPAAHYETTGPEIHRAFPELGAIVFSLGSGGTLNGVGKYLKENRKDIKIIGVAAKSGVKIPGTGAFADGDYVTPFIEEIFDEKIMDHMVEVDLESAMEGTKKLQTQGFYVGIQTGAVYSGMMEAIDNLGIKGNIVMISGDAGWKNLDKLLAIT